MILDCFTYFNELEVLEIRLKELERHVNHFVVVAGDHTFQGRYIPQGERVSGEALLERIGMLHLIERFHFQYVDLAEDSIRKPGETAISSWEREFYLRDRLGDFALEVLMRMPGELEKSLMLFSDADEIPDLKSFPPQSFRCWHLRNFYYKLNMRCGDSKGTLCVSLADYLRHKGGQDLREWRHHWPDCPSESGWHFSYLGDAQHIITKIQAFAHGEYNQEKYLDPDLIRSAIEHGFDLFGRPMTFTPVASSLPNCVQENRKRWSHRIASANTSTK